MRNQRTNELSARLDKGGAADVRAVIKTLCDNSSLVEVEILNRLVTALDALSNSKAADSTDEFGQTCAQSLRFVLGLGYIANLERSELRPTVEKIVKWVAINAVASDIVSGCTTELERRVAHRDIVGYDSILYLLSLTPGAAAERALRELAKGEDRHVKPHSDHQINEAPPQNDIGPFLLALGGAIAVLALDSDIILSPSKMRFFYLLLGVAGLHYTLYGDPPFVPSGPRQSAPSEPRKELCNRAKKYLSLRK
jgi:hypothetical protein